MKTSARWSEADIEEANELWKGGASASVIGNKFNLSRNAVLGLAHRERQRDGARFPRRTDGKGSRPSTSRATPKVKSVPRASRITGNIPFKAPDPSEPKLTMKDALTYDEERVAGKATNGAGAMIDMTSGQCHWPVVEDAGTIGGQIYCGAAVANRYLINVAAGRYCWHHLKRRSQPQ